MRRSMVHHIKQPRRARPLISNGRDALQYRRRQQQQNNRLHAGAISSSFGSATPISTHSIREATTGTRLGRPHPASRRLLPSLRELITFPFDRTFGRHSRKCQRLFQWRIDGRRELTGNWFSPRGAVGTKHDQSLISQISGQAAVAKISELSFNPPRLPRFRPRWRRGRGSQPNGQLARD